MDLHLGNWPWGSFKIINNVVVKNICIKIVINDLPAGEAGQGKLKLGFIVSGYKNTSYLASYHI